MDNKEHKHVVCLHNLNLPKYHIQLFYISCIVFIKTLLKSYIITYHTHIYDLSAQICYKIFENKDKGGLGACV